MWFWNLLGWTLGAMLVIWLGSVLLGSALAAPVLAWRWVRDRWRALRS